MWNGSFFQRTTLHDLGLRVQLGHALGHPCPTRLSANISFRVIHSNGIHQVAVDQCRCHNVPFYKQLLQIGWWPATPLDPRSAATFEVLRHFHILNLQGKVTGYSFYQALAHQTDNTGLNLPSVSSLVLPFMSSSQLKWMKDRLDTFMLMVRQWRHIKMVKRAGRAYDPKGIAATTPGSLAILCRACPLPHVNLPEGWENAPPERACVSDCFIFLILLLIPSCSWLYMLTVAMDANFRLKSRLRGTGTIDKELTLGMGWSYFVDNAPYSEFIKGYVDENEVRMNNWFIEADLLTAGKDYNLCWFSGAPQYAHQEVERASCNWYGSCQLRSSPTISTIRHGRFAKGRAVSPSLHLICLSLKDCFRQCNMDYLFTSSIAGVGLRLITISYDVGCQWFTNFWQRVPFLPDVLTTLLPLMSIRALVPKFHLQSHNEACHSAFSFNFFKGGARTDGEGVERNWDELNGQGPSTSEMLPGARWDTLDDCSAWVNWRKTMGLGA